MTGPWLVVRMLHSRGIDRIDPRAAAAWGLAALFAFTGIGHFAKTGEMVAMLPPWLPAREWLVYATGVLEFGLALGLAVPRTRRLAGWAALAALVLFFPANVYAALHHTGMGGHADGPAYLLIRTPLQLAIAAWTWAFVCRRPQTDDAPAP